ncbi:CopD family protein [Azospirillum doebereinerae]|uniref:CopD family protein n=1 Tax=Azospirillum doebereinerae TaxID=92933 RepID=UPI001EE52843|nr:CopD family protein [Azospirillum doebereinerae]MCG5242329.1 CopD family protein [Azospirillum doebereinerae]
MIEAMKFVHIAAIALWTAGLVGLPSLYVQRAAITDDQSLYRLQKTVRFAYTTVLSPAAFTAVASGIALIFLREVFVPWFSLKLGFVALLGVAHVLTGLVIIRLFREGEGYPAWRCAAATILTALTVLAILLLVLAKPAALPLELPAALSEPGGLRRLLDPLNPWSVTPSTTP